MGYRLPLVTTIATFFLMILGALVVGEDAGFVCPDWPLCKGTILPHLNGLIVLELAHRALTTIVTVLVVLTLAVVVWRRKSAPRGAMPLAIASLVLLFAQAAMGALIVVLVLPGAATTVDVMISFLLLGSLCALTALTARGSRKARSADERAEEHLRRPLLLTLAVLFVQLMVGAYFRHSGESEALFGEDTYLRSHFQHTMPAVTASYTMLIAHIVLGAATAAAVVWLTLNAVRARALVRTSLLLLVITVAQMALGFVSFGTRLAIVPVTIHWSLSGIMWACVVAPLTYVRVLSFENAGFREKEVIA